MKAILNFIKRNLAVLVALVSLSFFILGSIYYSKYRQGIWEKDIRANLQDVLIGKKSEIEKALYSRIYYTRGVAAYVSMHPQIGEEEYAKLAGEFIKNDDVIGTMALSKDGIITYIYPKEGHETAIGLNLLEHPERRQIVEKTIETHHTFIAGPVELVEGGTAFISYTPVFSGQVDGKDKFWGVTDIVILKDKLLNEAGLLEVDDENRYALRGYNGRGNDGAVFWGDGKIFEDNPVSISIDLPTGSWVLASVPQKGWGSYMDQDQALLVILIVSSLIISLLLCLFTRSLVRIRNNAKELAAIFRSMDSLVIELNKKGEYVKIAPTNKSLLLKPEDELIGKSLYDILEHELAKSLHDAILQCLINKETVIISYPLEINGNRRWFSAHISYKTESTVIFNAHDITELKNKEESLVSTTNELAGINAMKDMFFSIIAHDLRGPMSSYKAITDILVQEYDGLQEEERIELVKSMQKSSSEIVELLDNLLNWSNSQGGRLTVNKQSVRMKELVQAVLMKYKSAAELKELKLINNVQEQLVADVDVDMFKVVLRNLVSNAVKFSHKQGDVVVASELSDKWVTISVKDQGVGIPSDKLESLFQINKNQSTIGTLGEKGTGLGLTLCKEFVEKQGGRIWVDSNGTGASFCFTIPL